MDQYYYKYIKYKTKYLELKGGKSQKQKAAKHALRVSAIQQRERAQKEREIAEEALKPKHILFMFLGGLPNTDHWNKFLETANDKLICIVHPKNIPYKIPPIWKTKESNGTLLIVDEKHHLKTGWGVKSLTDAELMMMQYALVTKGNIFKKFVLLSPNDGPLYRFNVIYNELMKDNKSWFGIHYKWHQRRWMKKIYIHEGGEFDFDEVTTSSQWNAIDNTHLEFYFDINKLSKNEPTYIKVEEDFICDNNEINIVKIIDGVDIKFQKYLNSFNGFIQEKLSFNKLKEIDNNGFCIVTDVVFFITILKHELKLRKQNFWEHLKTQNISYINNTNNYRNFIKPILGEELNNDFRNIKYKLRGFVSNSKWNNKLKIWESQFRGEVSNYNRIWYGADLEFDSSKTKLNSIENSEKDEKKQWFLFEKNILKDYSQEELDEKKDTHNRHIKDKYKNNPILNDLYSVGPSMTDWSLIPLNPGNIIREFKYKTITSIYNPSTGQHEKVGSDFNLDIDNISEFFKKDPEENINKLLTKLTVNGKPAVFDHINYNTILSPRRHPLEYVQFKLTEVVNAYNLLILFDICNDSFHILMDLINEKLKDTDRNDPETKKIRLTNKFIKEVAHSKLFEKDIQQEINQFQESVSISRKIADTNIEYIYYLHLYNKAKWYYERIINENIHLIKECEKDGKKYYVFKTNPHEDPMYGIPVSSYFLNNSLTHGSLFLRKLGENNCIEEYSDQLFKLPKHVHTLNKQELEEYTQREILDNQSIPFKYEKNRDIIKLEGITNPYYTPHQRENIEKIKKMRDSQLIILYLIKELGWNIKSAKNVLLILADIIYKNYKNLDKQEFKEYWSSLDFEKLKDENLETFRIRVF